MRLAQLSRWHWLVIALIVGIAGGYARQASRDFEDELDSYGTFIKSRKEFERAITTEVQGHRLFQDLTVYPYHVPGRARGALVGGRLAHIVHGWYWSGRPEVIDGKPQARYVRAFYLAPVPYRAGNEGVQGARVGTVLDYLADMHRAAGVQYRYAWWWWAMTPMGSWILLSVAAIAGVWPTVINLLAFGTLRRPAGEPTFSVPDLWRLRSTRRRRRPAEPERQFAPSPDEAQEPEPKPSEEPTPAEVAAAAVRPLGGAAEPVPPPVEPADAKAFGGRKEDFYPTELHGPATREETERAS